MKSFPVKSLKVERNPEDDSCTYSIPSMSSNIFETIFLVADSLAWILLAKLLDETFGLSRNSEGDRDGVDSLQNLLVDIHVVFGVKGSFAAEKLENEDAEAPQIGGYVVALVRDDLKIGLSQC